MDRQVSLKELLFSETATRLGIDNTPTDQILINLQTLIYKIIEPIINHFGDIKITSGYRSPELCKAIGSSITSQHTKGEAVDFIIPNISNQEASLWIVKNLEFDQCILEFWNPETNSGWIHCSYSSTNRKMYLRAFKSNGRVIYEVL